jgi:hypothetical protein
VVLFWKKKKEKERRRKEKDKKEEGRKQGSKKGEVEFELKEGEIKKLNSTARHEQLVGLLLRMWTMDDERRGCCKRASATSRVSASVRSL